MMKAARTQLFPALTFQFGAPWVKGQPPHSRGMPGEDARQTN